MVSLPDDEYLVDFIRACQKQAIIPRASRAAKVTLGDIICFKEGALPVKVPVNKLESAPELSSATITSLLDVATAEGGERNVSSVIKLSDVECKLCDIKINSNHTVDLTADMAGGVAIPGTPVTIKGALGVAFQKNHTFSFVAKDTVRVSWDIDMGYGSESVPEIDDAIELANLTDAYDYGVVTVLYYGRSSSLIEGSKSKTAFFGDIDMDVMKAITAKAGFTWKTDTRLSCSFESRSESVVAYNITKIPTEMLHRRTMREKMFSSTPAATLPNTHLPSVSGSRISSTRSEHPIPSTGSSTPSSRPTTLSTSQRNSSSSTRSFAYDDLKKAAAMERGPKN